ncbi:hypothetical protein M9Y10_034478 [Tritrichomonas musculus]|uniref:Uncharacterized protein n=1 Tax=Tritrichomonas musculus TaxID=1915356 RepID=A0ABR2KF18_9EUKA
MFIFETPEEAIIRLHLKGHSVRLIKSELRVGTDRIQNAIHYYHQYNEIPEPKKKGRPSKETDVVMNMISTLTINYRTMSCYQIAKTIIENGFLSISSTTVYRYRIKLEFHYKPPKIRQKLKDFQIFNRLLFAHSMLLSNINMSKIVFSDESRFCVDNDNVFRWYRKDEITDNFYPEHLIFLRSNSNYSKIKIFIV